MEKLKRGVFLFIRYLVRLFYPQTSLEGLHNLPQEPCILVGNHAQMNGPIVGELYIPGEPYTWCAGEMMELKEVPAYAYRDFWSRKPGWSKWFYKLLSYIIAPLSVCIFNNARTIPVYHDKRLVKTFRATMERLEQGRNVLIFPEHEQPYDRILCDFQTGFVDVARIYYKQTGKCLSFVPMYLAPSLHTAYLGEPITYCPENPIKEERRRICQYLMASISATAQALPRHRLVPYSNVSKKEYGYNREEECSYEKTGS